MSCSDAIVDLDDDNHLSSWIELIEFTNKTIQEESNDTSIKFTIDFEIWNPGPFRIQYQSSGDNIGFPHSITQSGNSNFILTSHYISEKEYARMFCTSTTINPGIHHFQWTFGVLYFNGSVPDSNPYLPDGNYRFVIGDDQWIECHQYDINVSSGILTHSPSQKPLHWGDSTTNLGNPLWYIFGLPFLVLILVEWRINVKEGLPKNQNE
ncbi:MAG: hypothetical protein ACTSWK_03985 [Promethearchaeota archaeon]